MMSPTLYPRSRRIPHKCSSVFPTGLTTNFPFSFSVRVLWRVHDHARVRRDRTRGRRRHCYFAGEQEHQTTRHHRRSRTHRSRLHLLAGKHGVSLTADTDQYVVPYQSSDRFPKVSKFFYGFRSVSKFQRVYFPSVCSEQIWKKCCSRKFVFVLHFKIKYDIYKYIDNFCCLRVIELPVGIIIKTL